VTSENASGAGAPSGEIQLSVIIPCYNAAGTIGEQLESLARQDWLQTWEVLVVDNRSTDRSREIATEFRGRLPNLRIIDAFERQGAAYAMNVGVRTAQGKWIAFCDADDVVAEGWIRGMASALSENEFVSGPHEVERLNTASLAKSRGNAQPTGVQQYRNPPFLPHAGSGNFAMHRTVLDRVGGFDESMVALYDTDFCWRAQLMGIRLTSAPQAVLHVRYRGSTGALIRQAKLFGEWNVFIYKRYRKRGMPALSLKQAWTGWKRLVRGVGALTQPERRADWLWNFGWRIGRLKGCLKYRVLAP
jgi:glycosyltransferase involved in cell wall biosynthesis